MYGNNNLPDSSNMCHESTSVALPESIGVPVGTCTLDDFYQTQGIFFFGQNVGTSSPRMLHQLHCPVIGVVENMSYFVCPDCGERDDLFGAGGGAKLAEAEGTRMLSQIPIYLEVREAGDAGMPIVLKDAEHPVSRAFMEVARRVLAAMPKEETSHVLGVPIGAVRSRLSRGRTLLRSVLARL
jgi:hypothetical protein